MCGAVKLGRLAANAVNDKRQGSATRHGSQGGGGAGNGAAASTAQGWFSGRHAKAHDPIRIFHTQQLPPGLKRIHVGNAFAHGK